MKRFCYACDKIIRSNQTFAHEYMAGNFNIYHQKCWDKINKDGAEHRVANYYKLRADIADSKRESV